MKTSHFNSVRYFFLGRLCGLGNLVNDGRTTVTVPGSQSLESCIFYDQNRNCAKSNLLETAVVKLKLLNVIE